MTLNTIVPFAAPPADSSGTEPSQLRDFGRRISDTVRNILGGKLNAVTEITLTANAATTTLTDSRITFQSVIVLVALTANAQIAVVAGYYITNRISGSCTINHLNSATTDKDVSVLIIG